jgi:hypothetical protein
VGQPAADLAGAAERTWVSGLQNNVLPAPQVRVGPGLGLRADQTTGCDGFHPMLRVLPKNVGEYKKVNLPGAVNHGFAPIAARDAKPGEPTRDPNAAGGRAGAGDSGPLYWDMQRRPMQPSRAALTAPRVASEFPRDGSTATGHRPLHENYLGNPVGTVCGVSGPLTTQGDATRDGNQALSPFPATNVTGAATGPATLGAADFDPARFQQQREQRPPELGGPVAGVSRGAETRPFDAPGATLRQLAGFDGLGRGGLQNVQGSEPARTFGAPGTTLRELSTRGGGEVLNPTAPVAAQRMAAAEPPQPLDRQAKRAEYSAQTAQRPAPGRTNVRADASVAVGAVALRDDDKQVPDNATPALPVPRYDATPGKLTTTFNKLPSANPRLDLGVAAAQLAANPLAKTW